MTLRSTSVEAELCRRRFREHARRVVPLLTGVPLRENVAVGGMIELYQALGDRRITRARIEVGPGLAKSTLRVAYESWRLARRPGHRAIHASHAFDLAARDSRKARRLVESDWYRARFPAVVLRDDENTAAHWATTRDGRFVALGVGGSLTGHRAHEVVVDDAINAVDARSPSALDATFSWFSEGLMSRLDLDPDGGDGSVLVIGQRLAVGDLHGKLEEQDGWTVLRLPAEYDSARPCIVLDGTDAEIWRDPRTTDGELVAPDTLPREKLDRLRVEMGSVAYHAQLNQRPSDDSTALVKLGYLRYHREAGKPDAVNMRPRGAWQGPSVDTPRAFSSVVIAADLGMGAKTKDGDFSVVVAIGQSGSGFYVLDVWRQRADFPQIQTAFLSMARRWPHARKIVEKAAAGASLVASLRHVVPGLLDVPPQGNKVQRLHAVLGLYEAGNVHLDEYAPQLHELVHELTTFPGARHDDFVDAMSLGLSQCAHVLRSPLESVPGHAVASTPVADRSRAGALAVLGGRGRSLATPHARGGGRSGSW